MLCLAHVTGTILGVANDRGKLKERGIFVHLTIKKGSQESFRANFDSASGTTCVRFYIFVHLIIVALGEGCLGHPRPYK